MIENLFHQNLFTQKKYLIFVLFFVISMSIYAQDLTVSGVVSDQNGPLPGVSVIVDGTANGTATDFDGNYSLTNVPSDGSLTFSYIGFLTQLVPVDNRSTVNLTLVEDLEQLDEVVVVGYGTQSRAEVTGAISTIGSDEITALPITRAEEALQGRVSGVTIINNGSPGASPEVRIRGLGTMGNNSPLYVIDGVIVGSLGSLNPSDIETMTVLKDASTTAIYGAQGSNGVIMITTKKGQSGLVKVSLNTYLGSQWTDERYDLLNTEQYIRYADEAFGLVPTSSLSSSGLNTNWQDEIFQSGLMKNYDLSISGGGENSNFRVSGGYMDQEGVIVETGFKRYSFRANSNFNLGEKLTIGQTVSVSSTTRNPERSGGGRSLIEHAIKSAPYLPVYNENNLGGFQGPTSALDAGNDAENGVRVQTLGEQIDKSVSILGSVFAEWKIIDGLKFKSQLGVDYFSFNNNSFVPSFNDDSNNGSTHAQAYANIVKNSGSGNTTNFTNSLTFEKTFSEVHNVDALLVYETFENEFTSLDTSSQNPITNEVNQVSNEQSALSSGSSEVKRIGYLGRVNYNFDEKYLVAVSMRRDASSRFGANNRWGWFPSAAIGWHISNESFMDDYSAVNELKLRASWGVTGNDKIGNYLYSSTLTSNFTYPFNNSLGTGTTSNGLANADLKWEETTMTNIGLDAEFLNGKITTSLEYYNNTSDDLLMSRPTPTSLGYHVGSITENVGSVETNGLEISLGYNDYEGDFTWSANLNLGTSNNEVKSLGGVEEITGAGFEGENLSRITEGESLFYFYGLEMDGIYQTRGEVDEVLWAEPSQTTVQAGDVRYVDHNEDGYITSADKVKIGEAQPNLTFGLALKANLKNWDFSLFLSGVSGNDVYNTNKYDLEGMPRLFNAGTAVINRWNGAGTSTTVPRSGLAGGLDSGAPQNAGASSRFIEDGSYARLRNLTIGYTFKDLIDSDIISNFRIYLTGQNLFTITDYSGLDPEVGLFNGGQAEIGVDRGNYPVSKSFTLGVQLQF